MNTYEGAALAWVALAILAAIVEVSIPHFGVIFVSVGAVAAALMAFLDLGAIAQVAAFVVVLTASLAVLRPRLVSRFGSAKGVPSRTDALIGREGVVTVDIDRTVGTGRVNVGGDDWAARSPAPITSGTRVRVVGADGIILEVRPV